MRQLKIARTMRSMAQRVGTSVWTMVMVVLSSVAVPATHAQGVKAFDATASGFMAAKTTPVYFLGESDHSYPSKESQ